MDRFAPCPFCRFQIPEFSEVCGNCHNEVGWHGGWPYDPEVAEQKWAYTGLIWRGWPWKTHILLIAGLLAYMEFANRDNPNQGIAILAILGVFIALITGAIIYAIRWLYVRARY